MTVKPKLRQPIEQFLNRSNENAGSIQKFVRKLIIGRTGRNTELFCLFAGLIN